jgi:hypothetical protein
MQYFINEDESIVRVHTKADRKSRKFFFSTAEVWDSKSDKWLQRPGLIGEILHERSDYRPTGDPVEQESRWMGVDSPICTQCGRPIHAGDEVMMTTYEGIPTTGNNWIARHLTH